MASNEDTEQPSYKSRQIKLFLSVVESTLDKIYNNVPVEEYRQVMENIKFLKQKPHMIYKTYSSLKESIKENVLYDLNETLQEDNFDDKFCKLNDIISKTDNSKGQSPVWRPPGNVNEHMRSSKVLIKLKQKSELELLLSEKEKSVSSLNSKYEEIQEEARKKINLLLELINRTHKSNEKIQDDIAKLCTQLM